MGDVRWSMSCSTQYRPVVSIITAPSGRPTTSGSGSSPTFIVQHEVHLALGVSIQHGANLDVISAGSVHVTLPPIVAANRLRISDSNFFDNCVNLSIEHITS